MQNGRADMDTRSAIRESVYDAAMDPESWSTFLRRLARPLNAKSGLLRVIDERAPAVRANAHCNLDPDLQHAHRDYYVHQDVYLEALHNCPGTYIAPGEAFVDERELRSTEFFADYLQPQDSYHICGGLAMRNDQFTIMFGVQRDRRPGPFSERDAAFMRWFVPHIRRAIRLSHLLDVAEQHTATAEQALESLAVAVVLLDEQDRIVHTNAKAERLMREKTGLMAANGRLVVANDADATPLRDALTSTRSGTLLSSPATPATLMLMRDGDRPQLMVMCCPLAPEGTRFTGPWPNPSTAVFMSDLEDAGMLNHDALTALYGLTETEARLACALSRGYDLGQLCDEWHISRETLRTHLKRVLHKTGTTRQAELVRLLAGAPWRLTSASATESADAAR